MEEKTKQEAIHDKGFAFGRSEPINEYGKIKVGVKTLQDATIELGNLAKNNPVYTNKNEVLKALAKNDVKELRAISNYFYRTNGIYQKICNYLATMYRYDWYIVPEVYDETVKPEKIVTEFNKILNYLDNSYIQNTCMDIALKVIREGAYYACIIKGETSLVLQELPVNYCRTRYSIGNLPVVEFNMAWFDSYFTDLNYRMRVLGMFPKDIQKGYALYKQGKLTSDWNAVGSERWKDEWRGGWYPLEPGTAIKFSLASGDGPEIPWFVSAIPDIIDLDAAQDLDRKKQMQQLLKIIVQKLPMDKNGDLIFDIDEARDIHNNAVQMLQRAVGVDVLTTFADIESIDMSDTSSSTTKDDLDRVERTVYNSLGVSKNLFNTEGNLSLEKSILEDAGSIRKLLLQFRVFFDKITQERTSASKKKYNFRLYMLETTQYNYKELSKMYKEQAQTGNSKLLPQIALGHSQSSIINTAYFENNVLHLYDIMIPPLMSSVMNSESILANRNQSNNGNAEKQVGSNGEETKGAGRPEKPESQKSDKTIANEESKS